MSNIYPAALLLDHAQPGHRQVEADLERNGDRFSVAALFPVVHAPAGSERCEPAGAS